MQNLKSEIIKYIHIGMPKNLSSSLQGYFFSKHPQLYHLGVGVNSLIDYVDDEVNVLFENYLMYSKDFEYHQHKERFKTVIDGHIKNAVTKKNKAVGVSLELLSFSFTPDMIDVSQKAERLRGLFGGDTKIILVIRNQKSLLESMYREFIKIGYDKSYKEFIDYIYIYKSRSFLYELLYENLINLYSGLFGFDNLSVLIVENYRGSAGELLLNNDNPLLIDVISDILNVDHIKHEIGHANKPLSNGELFQKRSLNQKYRHDLSNKMFEGVDNHRLYRYFDYELKVDFPDPFHDVKIKRDLTEYAKSFTKNDSREIDYYADPEIMGKLEKMFIQSNERVHKKYGIKLPACYFNMGF